MALMNCPECGGKVSDRAAACPHCGYPLQPVSYNLQETEPGHSDGEDKSDLHPMPMAQNSISFAKDQLLSNKQQVNEALFSKSLANSYQYFIDVTCLRLLRSQIHSWLAA